MTGVSLRGFDLGKSMLVRQVLYKELLQQFILVLVAILFVISINQFTIMMRLVSNGSMSFHTMLKLLSMMLPNLCCFIIPPCLFFAILFVLSRYHLDSEMIILLVSGVSYRRIFYSVIFFSTVIAIFVAVVVFELFPSMEKATRQIEAYASKEVSLKKLKSGGFSSLSNGGALFTRAKSGSGSSNRIVAFLPNKKGFSSHMFWQVVSASDLNEILVPELNANHKYFVFNHGGFFRASASHLNWEQANFDQWGYQVPVMQAVPNKWPENLHFLSLIKAAGQSPVAASYFFWRLSLPLSIISKPN